MSNLKHPVSGELKKLTETEFLDLFDPSAHNAILASANRYKDADGIVCFENLDMWSSQFGDRTALVVGPSNSWTLEQVVEPGFRLGDVPSRFQYPVSFVDYRPRNATFAKNEDSSFTP